MNRLFQLLLNRSTAIVLTTGLTCASVMAQESTPPNVLATQVTGSTFTSNAVLSDIELIADPSSALTAKGDVGFAGVKLGAEYTKTVTAMVPRVRAASTYIRPGSTVSGTTATLNAQLKSIKLNGGSVDAAVLEIGAPPQ